MADETKVEAQAAAEAPAKVAEAIAETVEKTVAENAKVAKRTRAATARSAKREAIVAKPASRRAKAIRRKTRNSARKTATKPVRAAQKRNQTMTNNAFFKGFEAVPAFAPFQSLFADANERSQELAKKTQKVAGELTDLARANVEAVVEASRVAAEGAKAIGQDAVSSSRTDFELAAAA